MKKNCGLYVPKTYCLLLFVLLCSACRKQDREAHIGHFATIDILNDQTAALAARAEITSPESVDVEIRYREQGASSFTYGEKSTNKKKHSIGLFPLKEKTTYEVEITLHASSDMSSKVLKTELFTTASVPQSVSSFYTITQPISTSASGGYYLFASMSAPGCIYVIDEQGKLIWYHTTPHVVKSVHMTDRNTILSIQDENATPFGDGNIVIEQSLAGDTLFYLRQGQRGFDKSVHHDLKRDPQGNIIAVTNVLKDNSMGDGLVKWSSAGNKTWEWTTFDVAEELDSDLREQPWINSIYFDDDGNYLLSLRAVHQIWKVNAKTGKVHWKLGKGGNLPVPDEAIFLRQHYAHRNASGDIMLFDNGDASRPYSRVLSFAIDENKRSTQKKMDIHLPKEYYSPIMGSAKLLPDGNVLVASSSTNHALKLDQNGTILWTLQTKGSIYRIEYLDRMVGRD